MVIIFWYTWVIYYPKDGEKYFMASFSTRKKCIEWLEMMKEKDFFICKDMNIAESRWAEKNFIIDYCLTVDRESMDDIIDVNLEKWRYE